MDLGIRKKSAMVCAASKGLGKGCAMKLAEDGVNLTICARTAGPLEETAREIRSKTGICVTALAVGITTEKARRAVMNACPQPDILINNAGGPPPGDFNDFTMDDWRQAVESSMITTISLIHSTVYEMIDRGF